MAESDNEDPIDAIYETNEKGDRVIVRSQNSDKIVWFRFINKTSQQVDIWWRDYEGEKQFYERIDPGDRFKMYSYLTFPFEFSDAATNESYVINNKPLFRAPAVLGGMQYLTDWYITIPVRSLFHTSLLAVASLIHDPEAVDSLGLPNIITEEIKMQVSLVKDMKPAPWERSITHNSYRTCTDSEEED